MGELSVAVGPGDDINPEFWLTGYRRTGIVERYQNLPSNAEFMLLEGDLSGSWTDMYGPGVGTPAVVQIAQSGNLMGAVTTAGNFILKFGDKSGPWIPEYGPGAGTAVVVSAAVFGDPYNAGNDRLGIITQGGELFVKLGDPRGGAWVDMWGPNDQTTASVEAVVAANIAGVVTQDGYFKVKIGSNLSGSWTTEYGPNPVVESAIAFIDTLNTLNDRLGVLTQGGDFQVKAGDPSGGGWTDLWGPLDGTTQTIQGVLSADLAGIVTQDGQFKLKRGAVTAQWYPTEYGPTPPVTSAAAFGDASNIANDRLAVVTQGGESLEKQGDPGGGGWTDLWGPNKLLPPVNMVVLS